MLDVLWFVVKAKQNKIKQRHFQVKVQLPNPFLYTLFILCSSVCLKHICVCVCVMQSFSVLRNRCCNNWKHIILQLTPYSFRQQYNWHLWSRRYWSPTLVILRRYSIVLPSFSSGFSQQGYHLISEVKQPENLLVESHELDPDRYAPSLLLFFTVSHC